MDSRIAATIAGAAATAPMTAVMMALHQIMPGEPDTALPPRHITERAAKTAGAGEAMNGMSEEGRQTTTLAAHFSYGAAAGVAYLPLAGKSGLPPAAEGALFGLAVWGGSYLGLMPAAGLYNAATEDPAPRNVLMIAAHLVWGASLGVIYDVLRKRNIEGF
jgi:putative membrane protein